MFRKKLDGLDVRGGARQGKSSLFCCCVQKSQSCSDSLSGTKQESENYGSTNGTKVATDSKEDTGGNRKLTNGSCPSEKSKESKVLVVNLFMFLSYYQTLAYSKRNCSLVACRNEKGIFGFRLLNI